jgi:hypothetical protein
VPPGLWFVLGLVAEERKRGAVEDVQNDNLNVGFAGGRGTVESGIGGHCPI